MLDIILFIILIPFAIVSIGLTCMFAIGLIAVITKGLAPKRTKLKN